MKSLKRILISICVTFTCVFVLLSIITFSKHRFINKGSKFDYNINRNVEETILLNFVEKNMIVDGGVRTNYYDVPFQYNYATGSEVLSESQGMLMLYYALTNDQIKFDYVYNYLKNNLIVDDTIVYREDFYVNCSIDDLRVIRALIYAGIIFKDTTYHDDARLLADNFYKTNVKNNELYDFYDTRYKITNNYVTLTLVDLDTIKFLGEYDQNYADLYDNMLSIVKGGYISDEFPIFQSSYSYVDDTYSTNNIHMTEAMVTLYHLAQVGELPETSLNWVREHVYNDAIYGSYSANGTPSTNVESTAIYAIAALIGSAVGDMDLYHKSIERMNLYQNKDKESDIYGAFGDSNNVYSFDQLTSLLAYRGEYNANILSSR